MTTFGPKRGKMNEAFIIVLFSSKFLLFGSFSVNELIIGSKPDSKIKYFIDIPRGDEMYPRILSYVLAARFRKYSKAIMPTEKSKLCWYV